MNASITIFEADLAREDHAADTLRLLDAYSADLMGDVMTDLQGRRSIVMGVDGQGRYQIIRTHTPLAELDRYSTTLRSLTQGRGTYSEKFHAYQPLSAELQHKLVSGHKEEEVTA